MIVEQAACASSTSRLKCPEAAVGPEATRRAISSARAEVGGGHDLAHDPELACGRRVEVVHAPAREKRYPVHSPAAKARTSSARSAGCSRAAKWPPRGITVQRRMSVNIRSASERGGRTISLGKDA